MRNNFNILLLCEKETERREIFSDQSNKIKSLRTPCEIEKRPSSGTSLVTCAFSPTRYSRTTYQRHYPTNRHSFMSKTT